MDLENILRLQDLENFWMNSDLGSFGLDCEKFSVEIELRFILGLDINNFKLKWNSEFFFEFNFEKFLELDLNLMDDCAEEYHKQWLALGLISALVP